jgi:hypothetical protein
VVIELRFILQDKTSNEDHGQQAQPPQHHANRLFGLLNVYPTMRNSPLVKSRILHALLLCCPFPTNIAQQWGKREPIFHPAPRKLVEDLKRTLGSTSRCKDNDSFDDHMIGNITNQHP